MAKIGVTETVLRDAHQSLIATRMRTDEFEGILEKWIISATIPLNAGAAQHLTPAFAFLMRILGKGSALSAENVPKQSFKCFSEVKICLAIAIMQTTL